MSDPKAPLNLEFVRRHFPGLNAREVLADNAGGSVPAVQVIDAVTAYLRGHMVQLGASYARSAAASEAVDAGVRAAARLVAGQSDEVVLTGSTTTNVYLLAQAIGGRLEAGDEIIISALDHEANVGAWRRLEARGVVVRTWTFDPEDPRLTVAGLRAQLSDKTKLVCFCHVSNVVGAIHPVRELCDEIRKAGAISVVDGVAFAPHRRVDVGALGCDVYLASLYKIYGPHEGLMWIRRSLFETLEGQNHGFIGNEAGTYKLELGYVNHELTAGLVGIEAYLQAVADAHGDATGPEGPFAPAFARFAEHEAQLAERLLTFLRAHPKVRVVGPDRADAKVRVPTIAFSVEGRHASEIPPQLDAQGIGIRWGDFYAKGAIAGLGLVEQGGVVRVSLVHYNTLDEVDRIVAGLDSALA